MDQDLEFDVKSNNKSNDESNDKFDNEFNEKFDNESDDKFDDEFDKAFDQNNKGLARVGLISTYSKTYAKEKLVRILSVEAVMLKQ